MKIQSDIVNSINESITGEPPETGGILGSLDGETITHFVMDEIGQLPERMCSYSPNVDFFNNCIEIWAQENIAFKGIVHTHFAGVQTLSEADKKYIYEIMNAMPEEINILYFPVFVLPDRKLICYKAQKHDEKTSISIDELEVVQER